jgi:hypothetical protein
VELQLVVVLGVLSVPVLKVPVVVGQPVVKVVPLAEPVVLLVKLEGLLVVSEV